MDAAAALKVFQLTQAVAALALAWRLIELRLHSIMRAMLAMQLWTVLGSAGAMVLDLSQANYFYFYCAVTGPACVINFLAIREMFGMIFRQYPGLRTMGRRAMFWFVCSGVLLMVMVARVFWTDRQQESRILYWLVVERSEAFLLAFVILGLLAVLSRYPLNLPRNFSISSALFSTIFLTEAVVLLIDTLNSKLRTTSVDTLETAIWTACLAVWAYMLRPFQIAQPKVIEPARHNKREQDLLAELESLNRVMEGAARH